MLGFPISTVFDKKIPKGKFYENLRVSAALRRIFIEQIQSILWKHKLATSTLNIAAGETVTEIQVFEVELKQQQLDTKALQQIDKEIPYHILFLLTCEGNVQAWMSYKEAAGDAFRVNRYYHTAWMPKHELHFTVNGLNMDTLYESLVRQIVEMQGEVWNSEIGVAENVARATEREKLKKQIAALENKIRKEKQLNRQMELNAELKKLKKELENLS